MNVKRKCFSWLLFSLSALKKSDYQRKLPMYIDRSLPALTSLRHALKRQVGTWVELTFAKTSGTITGDKGAEKFSDQ